MRLFSCLFLCLSGFLYLVDFFLHFLYIVLLNSPQINYTVQDTIKNAFFLI